MIAGKWPHVNGEDCHILKLSTLLFSCLNASFAIKVCATFNAHYSASVH